MGKIASISGALIFVASYVLLYFGLYGSLVEYEYTVKPEREWFNGSPHERAWNIAFAIIKPPPIAVIPKTVRSLLGKGARTGGEGEDLQFTQAPPKAAAAPEQTKGEEKNGAERSAERAKASLLDLGHDFASLLNLGASVEAEVAMLAHVGGPVNFNDVLGLETRRGDVARTSHRPRRTTGLTRREDGPLVLGLAEERGPPDARALSGAQPDGEEGSDDSLIEFLLKEARAGRVGYFAPAALIAFGIVLPLLKFLLVALFFLSSVGAISGKFGVANLHAASFISRWAAVDAVAEAGVVALMLQAGMYAKHEFGYTSFIGYVFLSGFAIWLMLPDEPRQPWLCSQILPGHRRLACMLVPTVGLAFGVFLYLGAFHFRLAAMHATLTDASIEKQVNAYLVAKGGPLLAAGKALLGKGVYEAMVKEFAHKVPKLTAELSVEGAVAKLLTSGHFHTITGSIAIFVGVLLMPLLEVVLGVFAVVMPPQHERHSAPSRLQSSIDFVAEFALLDVFVVGIAVCMGVMNSFSLLRMDVKAGFFFLAFAALLGWVHRFLTAVAMAPSKLDMMEEKNLPGLAKSCFEDMNR
mmetsp:Transcript_76401/g.199125  ORF Transcript_76401/g.199125 Transcript_76401/m.199125 type:complete len:581 (-) Transcript_76401:209-1951(-)